MSSPVLQYSNLPPGSRITAITTAQGVTISVPSSLLRPIFACLFACLILSPMTMGMIVAIVNWHENFSGNMYFAVSIFITVLIFWCAVVAIAWKIFQRRNIPTVINLTASQLTIVTPDRPTLRHDFQLNDTLRIEPMRIGLGVNLRATGALRIKQSGPALKILPGHDYREIQWIAHTLSEVINTNLLNQ